MGAGAGGDAAGASTIGAAAIGLGGAGTGAGALATAGAVFILGLAAAPATFGAELCAVLLAVVRFGFLDAVPRVGLSAMSISSSISLTD